MRNTKKMRMERETELEEKDERKKERIKGRRMRTSQNEKAMNL